MDSVCEECTDAKRKYDSCFNKWFSERFLNGHTDLQQCDELFKTYQECLKKGLVDKKIDLGDMNRTVLGSEEDKLGEPKRPEKLG
ncbi:hypothetical protein BV898_01639 [Hypsibius exemplaris]|uniref:TP53-regulated inhibitor of apoptosis 1 n=1 Tax=Hypsibius exemplaris TaxID=2072580 RepID=A0A1W0XAL7_HYPEX|nr:hypothetical protein BV898_01639 [Hypsibius exemplaris]